MTETPKITYTWTDEAPALATLSFLPVVQAVAGAAGIDVVLADISLSGRIIAAFSDQLSNEQKTPDYLAELGELAKQPNANIVKLPNISASVPQLREAIRELQSAGYTLPDYPDQPATDAEEDARLRYDRVKGSAVNPVLREGNSDRRAPAAVKNYARKNPHSMGAWDAGSKTHIATMQQGDFRHNEQSATMATDGSLKVELHHTDGSTTVLKDSIPVLAGEVVDATFMSRQALTQFLTEQIADAKKQDLLFSLHLKATMMKVSDPIIFGHGVKAYFADVFTEHATTLDEIGVNVNNGLGNLLSRIEKLPPEQRDAIQKTIDTCFANGPGIAMVNSDKGITNLHVPSDVIVDASMPAMIRASGQMWDSDGRQQDTKAVIPDSSYAAVYDETVRFHQQHGAFDPTTMGTCPNVGLMAQKAEEYGSHNKTFEIASAGVVRVSNDADDVLFEHTVDQGDIWRMCQVKEAPILDWFKLAVRRARATSWPVIFWLDENRPHDAQLIAKVKDYMGDFGADNVDAQILAPAEATRLTLERMLEGKNTISATGNVLRDYLTDLFPILELGTSAKMLSIVPLMNGGGLFETGAGGSAPKHVQQFQAENHLRWDSLGEFLALAVSLEHLADTNGNNAARVLGESLNQATEELLDNGKSPSRRVAELDTRGSHFYLTLYWLKALAKQSADAAIAKRFAAAADFLIDNEKTILAELIDIQGSAVDTGGYYLPDLQKATAAMRPSKTFNQALELIA